jgi:hypothetical protein
MAKPDLAFFNPVIGVVDVIDVDKFDVGTDVLRRRVARASGARGCMRAGKWILTMCAKRPMSRGAGSVAFLHRSAPSTDGRPMSSGELLTSGYEWPVAGSQTIVTTFRLKHKA